MLASAIKLIVIAAIGWVLGACDRGRDTSASGSTESARDSRFPAEQLVIGERLFGENCAECHGPQGQGHPDWQNAASGGFIAAPPLDASGPLPRRSHAALVAAVKAGVQRNGVPVMPAWQGRLADAEIEAIFAWVFLQWPAAQYETWRAANVRPAVAGTHPQ